MKQAILSKRIREKYCQFHSPIFPYLSIAPFSLLIQKQLFSLRIEAVILLHTAFETLMYNKGSELITSHDCLPEQRYKQ